MAVRQSGMLDLLSVGPTAKGASGTGAPSSAPDSSYEMMVADHL